MSKIFSLDSSEHDSENLWDTVERLYLTKMDFLRIDHISVPLKLGRVKY